MKKIISLIMFLVVLLSAFSVFAVENQPIEIEKNSEKLPAYWYKIAIKVWDVLSDVWVNHDSYYEHNSDWTYRYSESISFDSNHPTAYFENLVDNTVGMIRMHGHRDNPFDLLAKMTLVLFNDDHDEVKAKSVGTNQYMFYYPDSSNSFGDWKSQFAEDNNKDWTCYYAQYYNANKSNNVTIIQNDVYESSSIYYSSDGYVYRVGNNTERDNLLIDKKTKLSIEDLYEQISFENEAGYIDNFRDFNAGDVIYFEDTITDISYDIKSDTTAISFYDDINKTNVGWYFKGNLTKTYNVKDKINLKFDVVSIDTINGQTIESINYLTDYHDLIEKNEYPLIEKYLY